VVRLFGGFCDPRPDRIEIHIGQGRQQRWLIEQGLGFEPPFPEPSLYPVFGVGPASDVLVQGAHEPREIGKALPIDLGQLHDRIDLGVY